MLGAPRQLLRCWLARAASVAAVALLVAGCGGSAGNSASTTTARSSASASPAASRIPTGFAVYEGSGYSLAVPGGYKATSTKVAGQPAGSTVVRLSPSGAAPPKVDSEVLVGENPHLNLSLDQVIDNLKASERAATTRLMTFNVEPVNIAGASESRMINESYIAPLSPSQPIPTVFDRTWLMVLVRPGVLVDVIAANEPDRGGNLNLEAVIDSFRLGR